jgi:hypothetical protein
MTYTNIGTATIFWNGKAIKPGEVCPETCDASWLAYFVKTGVLHEGVPPVTPAEGVLWTPPPKPKKEKAS